MATRVLIVDDHLAIREGIRSLLAPEGDFVVVGEAVDGVDGITKALALKPDLIVLDNSMPNKTGLEVARELKPLLPETGIVFLTLDPGIRDLALAVGAIAHISKDTAPQQMLKVLRGAAQQQERVRNSPPSLTEKEKALATALLEAKLLTEQQLDTVVAQRQPRELLSAALIRSKLVPDIQLAQVLSRVSGRPLMRLAPHSEDSVASGPRPSRRAARRLVDPIDPTVARQLPRSFTEQRHAILVTFGRSEATLALADPFDEQTRREVQDMLAGIRTNVVTATLGDIDAATARAFGAPTAQIVAMPSGHAKTQKRRRRPIALTAAIAAVFLIFATGLGILLAPASSGLSARGQLTIFQGNVEYRRAGGAYALANSGQIVRQGDSVRTLANAHAALTFFDQSFVVFEPGTEVDVVALRALSGGDIDVTLRQGAGKTWHVVTHQQTPQGRYLVLTPTTQTIVAGTAFQVKVDAATGATTVTTTDGVVRTSGTDEAANSTVTLTQGNGTTVSAKGAKPQAPVAMPEQTITFALDNARDAVVVAPNGEAAGIRGGDIVRFIPGSMVVRKDAQVIITVPVASDRYAAIVQPADATSQDVHVSAELRTSGGQVAGQIKDQPAVAGGVAKSGVGINPQGLVSLSTLTIEQFPAPVIVAAPPTATFDPFAFVRGTSQPAGNPGP
ncbi:MAG TPA: response regulator, partial [Methylomirabilota bacterium]|nr:response regulator [Methylomirabilota bacterium]